MLHHLPKKFDVLRDSEDHVYQKIPGFFHLTFVSRRNCLMFQDIDQLVSLGTVSLPRSGCVGLNSLT